METKAPINPELLADARFDEVLAEYSEVKGIKITLTQEWRKPDIVCYSETTADGYEVWVLRDETEPVCISESVYYNEIHANDLFNFICDFYNDEVTVYCDLENYEMHDYLMDELHENWYNYQQALEDLK